MHCASVGTAAPSRAQAPCARRTTPRHVAAASAGQQPWLLCGGRGCSAAAAAAGGGGQQRWRQARRGGVPAAAAAADAGGGSPDAPEEVEWVEVGRIGPPHGVRGEMKVQPLTDFPEDRLGTPGPRWLQAPAPKIGRRRAPPPAPCELEWGRPSVSKGNEVWLVKLEGVESPEEAGELRGHALLVPATDRPPLGDEDEFYVQDLVGLQVFLQASGEEVGRVADVFDGTGTHDVLRIQLAPALLARLAAAAASGSSSSQDGGGSEGEEGEQEEGGEEAGSGGGGGGGGDGGPRHVLLPFAKALVPVVDLEGGRMEITPPEGLLELAAPSQMRRPRRENRGKRERRRTRPRGQAAGESTSAAAAGDSNGASA